MPPTSKETNTKGTLMERGSCCYQMTYATWLYVYLQDKPYIITTKNFWYRSWTVQV